jgi:hypothetical protein
MRGKWHPTQTRFTLSESMPVDFCVGKGEGECAGRRQPIPQIAANDRISQFVFSQFSS